MEKIQHSVSGARERSTQLAAKEVGGSACGLGGKVARMRVWGVERGVGGGGLGGGSRGGAGGGRCVGRGGGRFGGGEALGWVFESIEFWDRAWKLDLNVMSVRLI